MENNYLENHKKSGLKVGDLVRVSRFALTNEEGWDNCWCFEMNDAIGKEFYILFDVGVFGFTLDINGELWDFPYYVLELVSEIVLTNNEIKDINNLINEFDKLLT